jgi:hypothetical protein
VVSVLQIGACVLAACDNIGEEALDFV